MRNVHGQEFIKLCETATPIEIMEELTDGNIRGLDRLALTMLSGKRQLPAVVVNVLLVYFFNTFANQVYNRSDLARLYDYWAAKRVQTISRAQEMTKEDIYEILCRLRQ